MTETRLAALIALGALVVLAAYAEVAVWRKNSTREVCTKIGLYMHTVTPETFTDYSSMPVGSHICVADPSRETR